MAPKPQHREELLLQRPPAQPDNVLVVLLLLQLTRKVNQLLTDTSNLEAAVTRTEGKVVTVKQAIDDLRTLVASLEGSGVSQSVIDGFTNRLDAVDNALDAETAPPVI